MARKLNFIPLGPRPKASQAAEALLARMAANFPDLVDQDCDRALEIHTDGEELIEFLEKEIALLCQPGVEKAAGSAARIGRLLLDRARLGPPDPKNPYARA